MEIADPGNEGNAAADPANDRIIEIRVLEQLKKAVNDAYNGTTKGATVSIGGFGRNYGLDNGNMK